MLVNTFKLTRTKDKYHEIVGKYLRKRYIKTLTEEEFSKPVVHERYLHIFPPGVVRLAEGTGEALRIFGVITA